MKQYAIGLLTGTLLTISVFLFIGASSAYQEYDDYYDRKIWKKVKDIESKLDFLSVECSGGSVECDGGYVNCSGGSVECAGGYVNCY